MNSTEDLTNIYSSTVSDVIVPVVAALFITLSVAGNVLILCAVCFKPKFSRPANYMLASLSTSNLLQMSTMLSALLQMKYPLLSYGPLTCHLFPIVHAFEVPAEGLTVMCISMERSKVSLRPLEQENRTNVVKKIVAIWIASLLVEIPHGLSWKYSKDAPSYLKCVNAKELFGLKAPYIAYIWFYFLLVFIIPTLFMLKESFLLASKLKFLVSLQRSEWSQYQLRKYKLIRNALVFIVIFIGLRLPPNIVWFISRMPAGTFPQSIADWVSDWKLFFFKFGSLSLSVYPLIIFTLSHKVWELSACCLGSSSRPLTQPIYLIAARGQPPLRL